jgi:hypothetical protein
MSFASVGVNLKIPIQSKVMTVPMTAMVKPIAFEFPFTLSF